MNKELIVEFNKLRNSIEELTRRIDILEKEDETKQLRDEARNIVNKMTDLSVRVISTDMGNKELLIPKE